MGPFIAMGPWGPGREGRGGGGGGGNSYYLALVCVVLE